MALSSRVARASPRRPRATPRRLRASPRAEAPAGTALSAADGYAEISRLTGTVKSLPPSERAAAAAAACAPVAGVLSKLKESGAATRWDSYPELVSRNVLPGELKQVGLIAPESIGVPSVRNDAAFLGTVVVGSSVLAVLAGQLPGDIGFFSSYLIGGVSIAVLGIGSTAPGLLQFFIDRFSRVFPDYRERIVRHEAAHFLVGYCLGVPISGYSLDLAEAHTDFAEARLQRKIFQGKVAEPELNVLAAVAMAGVAGEATMYEEVVGQNADLQTLQTLLNRCESKLSDAQQQRTTRWAAYMAASILKQHSKAYEALQEKMAAGAPVEECFRAIEEAEVTEG